MPRRPRTSSGAPMSASIAAMRLLTADGTIASRSAARAMLRSSQTATNRRSVTGSKWRVIAAEFGMPIRHDGLSEIALVSRCGMPKVGSDLVRPETSLLPRRPGDKAMNRPTRRQTVLGLAALASLAIAPFGSALAQSDRVVRIILPVATASGVDTITRAAQNALGKALGHPITIENQPGAGGIVGTSALVKSAPDGFTLSVVSNNHVIYPSVLQVGAVRSGRRHHADRHRRLDADGRSWSNPQGAGGERQGAGGADEEQARPGQLRLVGQRHHPAPGLADVPRGGRRQGQRTSRTRAWARWSPT